MPARVAAIDAAIGATMQETLDLVRVRRQAHPGALEVAPPQSAAVLRSLRRRVGG